MKDDRREINALKPALAVVVREVDGVVDNGDVAENGDMTRTVLQIASLITQQQLITRLHWLLQLKIQLIRTRVRERDGYS